MFFVVESQCLQSVQYYNSYADLYGGYIYSLYVDGVIMLVW
jgi:hypothetical protein